MRFVLLLALLIMAASVALGRADEPHVRQDKVHGANQDEVFVKQEKGRVAAEQRSLSPSARPEGQPAASQGSLTSPNTCDQKNASSPECYAATQQGRGK